MSTLAGTTIRSPHEVAGEGCPAPCLDGVPGSEDGPLREATFYYPYGVAIGPNNTLLVADGDRIRRLTDSNMTLSTIQEVTSQDRVYTIAGQLIEGERDGVGPEASFNKPRVRCLAAAACAVQHSPQWWYCVWPGPLHVSRRTCVCSRLRRVSNSATVHGGTHGCADYLCAPHG